MKYYHAMDAYLTSMTLLITAIFVLYILNRRLAFYAVEGNAAWSRTSNMTAWAKKLVFAGAVASLPAFCMYVFAPKIFGSAWVSWIVDLALLGRIGFVLVLTLLVTTLVWRTRLSPVSVIALIKHLSKTVYRKLKPHWRKLAVGSITAVFLVVAVLPNLGEVLYFAAMFLLGKFGLLDGGDEDMEGYKYEDDDYYNDNYDYYYQQRQEEEYQREVDLGFH